jgi:N-methylhydantoinase B
MGVRSGRDVKSVALLAKPIGARDAHAGEGEFRGGMGVIRDYRVLGDDIVVSLSSERQHVEADGMQGGQSGARGRFIFNPGRADERVLPSAAADVRLPRDSVLRVCTPGGGGFGESAARAPAARERDQREDRLPKEPVQ